MSRFERGIGFRAAQLPVADTFLDPSEPLIDRHMPICFRVTRVLAPQPASLQIHRQSALVGDIVQPVTELVTGNPAKRAARLPDIEPFEDKKSEMSWITTGSTKSGQSLWCG